LLQDGKISFYHGKNRPGKNTFCHLVFW
jgi:ABC-type siderophore export system fused ATPase/permease subunit